MANNKRKFVGYQARDEADILNTQNNEAAGAEKNLEVGPHLLPLQASNGIAWTTDCTTIKALPSKGKCLAVYNNSATLGSVTLGETAAQASLAAGVTDASGHVGIPCKPNDWTRISCGQSTHVISSAATLLVFLVDDDSSLA